MKRDILKSYLDKTLPGFEGVLPASVDYVQGKVRDIFDLGDSLIIATSDRISAFDVVLSTIPCKGEILNRMALYWFDKTADILPNHIQEQITARTVRVAKCEVLPVEVVIRGYLTGSAWRDYSAGKAVSGIALPGGMRMNQRFDKPLVTPSTKAEKGEHDLPISGAEIVSSGLVEKALWDEVEEKAMALFQRGTELADDRGLILVDTKYEFGLLNGKLVVVDEVHTPDSSRFWYTDTYAELFKAGEPQRKIDKEFLRQWLIGQGYMGQGTAPVIPDDIRMETAERYIKAYELISGTVFTPESLTAGDEAEKILARLQQ